ncbi:oxidoreductase [Nocardioides flavus (ex Wang et al. 2016)]|uniref:Oxidoreductase n=1 Tax=Nocardioides flavus (ex Wang et al. 2016) TaxID=2058780 RepID=A0ABQ3HI97_9ACTN|nr:SDR family NAD(P)-dependent oxidoreductase [Nocardioides flavus (ex Wang et al. 2016)]GHE15623.1 oxidoreductase [Nocardioides flavus (ex Wang et al. 2016)]
MNQQHPAPSSPGIDPDKLAIALEVLQEVATLPPEHDDVRTMKRAASYMYKLIKKQRRAEIRLERQQHDLDIIARTATGSPMRIDDETAGIPLVSNAAGAFAGELITARGCYICKQDFTLVDAFYHWLCPTCAAMSHAKRDQRTDLTGKRALLTGGRAKIGMYIALRLLRDGAHTTITTRFPKDAVRRFAAMEDAADWLHRLKVVGIDLRDPTQVISLTDDVAADGPLDIIINNACQTVRRLPGAYSHLIDGEAAPLPTAESLGVAALPEMVTFDRISEAHPAAIAGALSSTAVAHHDGESREHALAAHNAASLTALALKAGGASLEAHLAGTAIDAGGLIPDVQDNNSWTQVLDEVDPLELLEVQFCNSIAPFLINSRLRPALRAAVQNGARRAYIVNVSAMEGQFGGRRYKGAGHPHTNMAKAALNMMTRTSSGELFETDQILMTAVDTGWITDERPHHEKLRIAAEGWHAPLDLVDGAARVYDPIVLGERGEDLYGCFLKDYQPAAW